MRRPLPSLGGPKETDRRGPGPLLLLSQNLPLNLGRPLKACTLTSLAASISTPVGNPLRIQVVPLLTHFKDTVNYLSKEGQK